MLKLLRYILLALVLLMICLGSALLAMRLAIHGREVRVPRLAGLTPVQAERAANARGLVISVESRFYSSDVPEGHIISQSPAPDTAVRRGWKLRVSESLGPQRASIPNVIGESARAAEINITRRGLEIGSKASIHMPGAQPGAVLAQDPVANATNVVAPKVNLVYADKENAVYYVMPNFVGQSLNQATTTLQQAGFTLGDVRKVATAPITPRPIPSTPGTIVQQNPAAGHKVASGATISFEVLK